MDKFTEEQLETLKELHPDVYRAYIEDQRWEDLMSAFDRLETQVGELQKIVIQQVANQTLAERQYQEGKIMTEFLYAIMGRAWYKRLFGIGLMDLQEDYAKKMGEAREKTQSAKDTLKKLGDEAGVAIPEKR